MSACSGSRIKSGMTAENCHCGPDPQSTSRRLLCLLSRRGSRIEFGMTVVSVVITPPETFARNQVVGRGRRKAARAHSVAAVICALGSGAKRFNSCSVCLSERSARRASSELHTADLRPQIPAKSKRSVDRHSMSACRASRGATRKPSRPSTAAFPMPGPARLMARGDISKLG